MQTMIHKFEMAGLGKAPYRYVGMEEKKFQATPDAPVQAGSICDYCPTAIMYAYWFESSDGKRFKVGCECALSSGDAGMRRIVTREEAKRRKAVADKRAASTKTTVAELMAKSEVRAALSTQPHPHPIMASKGKTLLDWAEFIAANAGASGNARLKKVLKAYA